MLWQKTPLGLAEVKARALDLNVVARNLLMLIDGKKTEAMFLAHTVGVRSEHFRSLFGLKLIEPVAAVGSTQTGSSAQAARESPSDQPIPALAQTLSRIISKQFGFGGMRLSQQAAGARTAEELKDVAATVLDLIRQRHGAAAADEAAWQIAGRDLRT